MVNFNSVVLAGQLTRDPELRYLPDGKACCDLRLSVSRVWKGKDGQNHKDVCFVDVVLWNRTAEVAAQYLNKGRSVLVHGRLECLTWIDKRAGEKRSKHRVVGNSIQFLSGTDKADSVTDETEARVEGPDGSEEE